MSADRSSHGWVGASPRPACPSVVTGAGRGSGAGDDCARCTGCQLTGPAHTPPPGSPCAHPPPPPAHQGTAGGSQEGRWRECRLQRTQAGPANEGWWASCRPAGVGGATPSRMDAYAAPNLLNLKLDALAVVAQLGLQMGHEEGGRGQVLEGSDGPRREGQLWAMWRGAACRRFPLASQITRCTAAALRCGDTW